MTNLENFEGMRDVVITEKLDGENTTVYSDGYIHARSMDGTNHPSRNWVKSFMGPRAHDIPEGWRVCGENVYGIHSIEYSKLNTFFFVFAVVDETNKVLAWDDVDEFCQLLEMVTVPIIYRGPWDEEKISQMIPGTSRFGDHAEGYVMRNAKSFPMDEYGLNVAKYVRKGHIQTDDHWTKNWKPATLGGE